jgi:hypothetical protein
MNCAHPIALSQSDNDLILTAYSLKSRGEHRVNKRKRPITTDKFSLSLIGLFTDKIRKVSDV